MRTRLACVAAFVCLAPTFALAALPQWTLEVERLRLPDVSVTEIRVESAAVDARSVTRLRAATIETALTQAPLGPVALECPGDILQVVESSCAQGVWNLEVPGGWPRIDGTLQDVQVEDGHTSVSARGHWAALEWRADLLLRGEAIEATLELPRQSVQSLEVLGSVTDVFSWASAGTLTARARFESGAGMPPAATAHLDVAGVDFDSPDGIYAALGLDAEVAARYAPSSGAPVTVEATITSGELLLKDFYRDFSGHGIDLAAEARLTDTGIEIDRFSVDDSDSLRVVGRARLPLGAEAASPSFQLRELRLVFPEAYERYLGSLAGVFSLDGLDTAGTVRWDGEWSGPTGSTAGLDGQLEFDGLDVVDARRGRFSLSGLSGTLRTGMASRLTWSGAAFEKLDIGAGEAHIALASDAVSLERPLRIPVFGGSLALEQLAVDFSDPSELDIEVRATLDAIEMAQMSSALGWPEFGGTLSGTIPRVSLADGVIGIDGALDFEVFGGRVLLTDLQVERPFGVLPSLAANISATALDLSQLTQTFEFGHIGGRVDGYVHELRMLDWEPVQFDAWFGTPEDAGRQDISRQAVRHLATIGGGNPTALLTGPVLRLFNDFSYRRIGIGCALRDNVCRIRGLEQQGDAVVLLEGAGIPKISIIAYNRAVDWPQLVAELAAASEGDGVRVGE